MVGTDPSSNDALLALLAWQVAAGAEDAIGEEPVDRLARKPPANAPAVAPPPPGAPPASDRPEPPRQAPPPAAPPPRAAVAPSVAPRSAPIGSDATNGPQLAEAATTFEELRAALAGF